MSLWPLLRLDFLFWGFSAFLEPASLIRGLIPSPLVLLCRPLGCSPHSPPKCLWTGEQDQEGQLHSPPLFGLSRCLLGSAAPAALVGGLPSVVLGGGSLPQCGVLPRCPLGWKVGGLGLGSLAGPAGWSGLGGGPKPSPSHCSSVNQNASSPGYQMFPNQRYR